MTMPFNNALHVNERAPSYSLTALLLLADPNSMLLDRERLIAIADISLRQDQPTTRAERALLCACARELKWLRSKLKQAFTGAYAAGDIDAATTQRLIDRFEAWDD
jgi:hypothetical protein